MNQLAHKLNLTMVFLRLVMVRTLVPNIGSSKTGNLLLIIIVLHYLILSFSLAGVQVGVWEVTSECHVIKAINVVLLLLPVIQQFNNIHFFLFFNYFSIVH